MSNDFYIKQLAEILTQHGYPTTQIKLFAELRERGYLIADKDSDNYNLPELSHANANLFTTETNYIKMKNGGKKPICTTKVTQNGVQYFIDLFTKGTKNGTNNS